MKNDDWTYEDISLLGSIYGAMFNRHICVILGRTKNAVWHKAKRLNLTSPKPVATWKYCKDCGKKLSRSAICFDKVKRCFKCAMKRHSGENHHNWQGGVSEFRSIVHVYLYNGWIKEILKRDNYTCQMCKKRGGDMEVHHNDKMYHEIRDEVLSQFPELSLDSHENKVFLAKKILKAHKNVSGVTLCVKCHSKIHNRKPSELLEYPKSHAHHNVSGNGKRDGMKSGMDWTISSQASLEGVEGPTTNANGPDRTMKRHECPARESVMI
jgi:hypothetical protein